MQSLIVIFNTFCSTNVYTFYSVLVISGKESLKDLPFYKLKEE